MLTLLIVLLLAGLAFFALTTLILWLSLDCNGDEMLRAECRALLDHIASENRHVIVNSDFRSVHLRHIADMIGWSPYRVDLSPEIEV
ncbi:MAG: hypothetical protein GY906_23920 [bacterium]|nr:hypothetical protein [bacterium]